MHTNYEGKREFQKYLELPEGKAGRLSIKVARTKQGQHHPSRPSSLSTKGSYSPTFFVMRCQFQFLTGNFLFPFVLPYAKQEALMGFGKGALLWLIGIPLPIIIILALFMNR